MAIGRKKAERLLDSEVFTVGRLRRMANAALSCDGRSVVNPTFTLAMAADIYVKALGHRADEEVVKMWRRDHLSQRKRSRDFLIAKNIVRDCYALCGETP